MVVVLSSGVNGRRRVIPLRYLGYAAAVVIVAGKVEVEMSETEGPPRSLVVTLATLTVIGGFLDAVSYLGLGHVFTANMTGNVVLVGFAAAGAPGFSVPAQPLCARLFRRRRGGGGRVNRLVGSHRTTLMAEMALEGFLITVAAVISASVTGIGTGWPRYTIIAVLSFAMGMRNVSVRRMARGRHDDHRAHHDADRTRLRLGPGRRDQSEHRSPGHLGALHVRRGAGGRRTASPCQPPWALGVAALLAFGAAAYFGYQEPLRLRAAHAARRAPARV